MPAAHGRPPGAPALIWDNAAPCEVCTMQLARSARENDHAIAPGGTLVSALLLLMPAQAQDKIPSPFAQETLIKTTLLTLNDANVTGNYTVLHAKLAKQFRDNINADKLKQAFKSFADQKIDFGVIAPKTPIATSESKIDSRGALNLRGYFDTKPVRLTYELDYLPSEGEWKPASINVNLKRPEG